MAATAKARGAVAQLEFAGHLRRHRGDDKPPLWEAAEQGDFNWLWAQLYEGADPNVRFQG
jgi:hypothetical protein